MKILIETDRLYLRELLDTDDMGIFNLDADPEVHKFLGNNPIKTVQQAKEIIKFIRQQYIDNGVGRLAIIEKHTDNFVGWGGFKLITEQVTGEKDMLLNLQKPQLTILLKNFNFL